MSTSNTSKQKSNKIEEGICAGELPQAQTDTAWGWIIVIATFLVHVVGELYISKVIIISVRILFEFVYRQLME